MSVDYPYCTRRLALRILELVRAADLPPQHATRALLSAAIIYGVLDEGADPQQLARELLLHIPDTAG